MYNTQNAAFFKNLGDQEKEKWYKLTSRVIAESLVVLKNDGNLLPLVDDEKVFIDESCKQGEKALTATGSGEMAVHLKETPAEMAFKDKTGDKASAKVHLACAFTTAGEGHDRPVSGDTGIEQPKPTIGSKEKTCVFLSVPGNTAISWADEVACIVMAIAPSVHGFNGLAYSFPTCYFATCHSTLRLPRLRFIFFDATIACAIVPVGTTFIA